MSNSKTLFIAIGVVAGLLIGFVLTSSIDRKERDQLRTELNRLRAATQKTNAASSSETSNSDATATPPGNLSEDEIRNAIQTADARPDDLYLQKNLGLALYAYANRTPSAAAYLPDVARFLKRACDANAKDREALVALGNVLFDIAQKSSEPAGFAEARGYYEKALALKPDDANTRTDLGLTYYLGQPSDPRRAITEYRRSLAVDPRHQSSLQNLAAALIKIGQRDEAQRRIDELQKIDAANPALPNLRAQLLQSRNAIKE
ncbi:MAG: tetratricopeptide repeat protein [Pyrinomonadaceae bacterium]